MDTLNIPKSGGRRILVLGLGGAGCNTLARIAPRAPEGMEFAVMDCDFQTLENCTAIENRVVVGKALTDGMSTGGDLEVGRRCVESSTSQMEALLNGIDLLIVITGLGGGFGTGAAPVVARMARGFGATTLFFTILPFPFEGIVAQGKAHSAIRRMRTYTDAIVEMPNALIQPDGDILLEESLERSSRILGAGLIGLWRLLACPGSVCNLDFTSMHTMLSSCDAFCRFACATATGEGCADSVVDSLLAHPLVKDSGIFEKAPGMIIGITGGEDLKLCEVQQIVDSLTPKSETCWVKMGIATDPAFAGRISVIVLAAEAWKEPMVDDGHGGLKSAAGNGKQGELSSLLKPRSKSFGDAERTIWNGEDLDVPAYIRRKIKLPR
jgi:cell division protein FtsZ